MKILKNPKLFYIKKLLFWNQNNRPSFIEIFHNSFKLFFDKKDNTFRIGNGICWLGIIIQKKVDDRINNILLELSDVWKIFIHFVNGLKALQEFNILNRDLINAKVFLIKDRTLKLGD